MVARAALVLLAAWGLGSLSRHSPLGFWTLLCLAALATAFVVPEPASHLLLLFGAGLAAVAVWRALPPRRGPLTRHSRRGSIPMDKEPERDE